MPELRTKKCTKCGKKKPLSEFCKSTRFKDGLSYTCKKCQKAYRAGNTQVVVNTKQCTRCGIEKPVSSFTKCCANKDGLHNNCKDCKQQFERAYKKNRRKEPLDIDSQNSKAKIDSWTQVDSVLREMAEMQLVVNKETEALEKRISLVKSYSDEMIEPCVLHQIALQGMLKMFIKKELAKKKIAVRRFAFGQVLWNNGKVDIELNVEFAKERLDKP